MKVAFTIAAESANAVAVTVQLSRETTRKSAGLDSQRAIGLFLTSDAAGLTPIPPANLSLSLSAGTAGELLDVADSGDALVQALTDAAGKLDLVVTDGNDGGTDYYLNVIDPATGKIHTSNVLAFTDNTP